MRLQVLANHCHEAEETVARFLGSLSSQEAVPWDEVEVLVCSDGTDNALSEDFLSSFGIPIRYEALEHSGVCRTRNALMDRADAEYLMFCDIDDSFHSSLALYRVLKAIDDLHPDIIASPYDVERTEGGKPFYRTEKRDTVHVFGKAFKRSYLVENGIRFPDEMPFSGDMYFLWLAFNLGPTIAWTRDSYYIWRENPASVTRTNPWHMLDSYPMLLRNYELLYANLAERGRADLQGMLLGAVFSMMYLQSHQLEYSGPEGHRKAMDDAVSAFAARHIGEYLALPDGIRSGCLESHRRIIKSDFDDGLVDMAKAAEWAVACAYSSSATA
jgi:glycosyltransferase involved in cell wall biosynthesis